MNPALTAVIELFSEDYMMTLISSLAEMDDFTSEDISSHIENNHKEFQELGEKLLVKVSKKRKKKDPERPKGAKNAYIFFSLENRKKTKNNNPHLDFRELTRKLASDWKDLDDRQKKKYKNKAVEDKERYSNEIKEYYDKYPDKKPVKTRRKKLVQLDERPKKGKSAWIFFSVARRAELKKQGKDSKSISTILSDEWKNMDDKYVWQEKSSEDKERYTRELEEFYVNNPAIKDADEEKKAQKKEAAKIKKAAKKAEAEETTREKAEKKKRKAEKKKRKAEKKRRKAEKKRQEFESEESDSYGSQSD